MTTYNDKYGTFFGRTTEDGHIAILHVEDGSTATRLDQNVYPIGSDLSARHEHPEGIILSVQTANELGIEAD